MMRRSASLRLAGALVMFVVLAACGANDEEAGNGSDTTAAPTTAPSTAVSPTTGSTPETTSDDRAAGTVDSGSLAAMLDTDRPVDGSAADAAWIPVIEAFENFAAERDIGAAVLAIAVDGEPVTELALGWSDLARTQPLAVDHRFRLASVTKPYTRALALELEALDLVDLDRQVFCTPARPDDCLIDVIAEAEAAGRPVLEEMADITLRHLIDHTAGFDSGITLDPMFAPLLVQADLGIDALPVERDIAAWIVGEPLVHTPGQIYAYSNVGYLAAGFAMEEAVGASYLDLLQTHLDTGDELILGSSLPSERAADEVEYACDEDTTLDLFDQGGSLTCWADGGFHLEAMTAHGRLVAPASEVLAFLDHRCIDGLTNNRSCDAWHDGSLSGTYTVARNFGRVDYVVLFNQRRDASHPGFGYPEVVDELDTAIIAVIGDPFAG